MKKAETLLTKSYVIIYVTSEFKFDEKKRNFIDSILGNKLQK